MKGAPALFALTLLLAGEVCADPVVEFNGIYNGQTIGGIYEAIEAVVYSDLDVDRVEFYLDGHLFRIETAPPYAFNGDWQGTFYGWDTTIYPNGEYEIRANAYDEQGQVGTAFVSFNIFNNHPPTASCEVDVNFGSVPLTVKFTGNAYDPDNQDLDFHWTFGDGGQSAEQNPEYTFTLPGVYIATFTVVDPKDVSASCSVCIRAGMLPYLEESGTAVIEAEGYDLWYETTEEEKWSLRTDKEGYSGQSFIRYTPDGGVCHDSDNNGPAAEYWIDFYRLGRYYVWVRGYAVEDGCSCKMSLNGSLVLDNMTLSTFGTWQWSNRSGPGGFASIDVCEKGVNVLTVHGREDGMAVDKIILATEPSYVPSEQGPEASPRASRRGELSGDCNFDGAVNILDLIFIRNRLGNDVNISDNRWADVNSDHLINVLDLIYTRNHIGDKLTE